MLPDKSYYEDEGAKKRMMDPAGKTKEAFKSWATVKRQRKIVKEALEFDGELAKYAQSNEEASKLKSHHPKTAEDINASLDTLSFTI